MLVRLFVLLLFVACGDSTHRAQAPSDLLLVGDSLTLRAEYSSHLDGDVYAFGGFTTADFLDAYDSNRVRHTVAVVLLGTNDAIQGIPFQTYGANIATLVDRLLYDGVERVILVTPPPIFFLLGRAPAANELLGAYREEIWGLCDVAYDAIECGPDLFFEIERHHVLDGIHFNEEGGDLVAELVRDILERDAENL